MPGPQSVALQQLEAMLWRGSKPGADDVAALLVDFPTERDRNAIVLRLHETFGNTFVQAVLRSERWSEAMAQGDGRSNYGRTSLPAAQQRRRANQVPHRQGPQKSEPIVSATDGEAVASTHNDASEQAALFAAHDASVIRVARSIERAVQGGGDNWQHEVVSRFEQASPAMQIELQQHLDMVDVLHRMTDWQAARLGVITPLINPAAQQHLNRKRAAYIARSIKEFGSAHADVLIAYIWQGVLVYDAAENFNHLARARMLTALRALPLMSQVLTAQGTDDILMAEPAEHPWALATSMLPNPLAMLKHHREKEHGNADLQSQHGDLPHAF